MICGNYLTKKGIQVAPLFLFFHKRLCGPLAHSRFHHQPDPAHRPNRKLEAAYHKTDAAVQTIADLLAALQLDLTDQNVEGFLFTIFDLRI